MAFSPTAFQVSQCLIARDVNAQHIARMNSCWIKVFRYRVHPRSPFLSCWPVKRRGQAKAFISSKDSASQASWASQAAPPHRATLSQEQLAAITAPLVPTRVIAGPGSGKTRVLSSRIVELVRVHDVKPWNILAITFTNKAANEIKERLQLALGSEIAAKIFTGTFHSFCYRILRQFLDANTPSTPDLQVAWPRQPGWSLYDQDASLSVIIDLVKSSYDGLKGSEAREKAKAVQSKVSAAKMNLNGAGTGVTFRELKNDVEHWLAAYEEAMRKANALDFDDLLLFTVKLLQQNELNLRERLHQRWKHILVDEFQDTNAVQYDLVTLLAYPCNSYELQPGPPNHVYVVGDQDQAIYGWRGALVDNMRRRFALDFPNGQVFRLRDNYRSTPSIIQAAQQIIKSVEDAERVVLRPIKNPDGPLPTVAGFFDSYEEAEHIGDEIQRLLTPAPSSDRQVPVPVEPSQIAVLFRTHQQSRLIEQALVRRNIHYVLVGSQPFWKRVEIQDIMAYLRLAVSLSDDVALLRIINVPKRGLGDASVVKLMEAAAVHSDGSLSRLLFEQIEGVQSIFTEIGLSRKAIAAVYAFREMVLQCRRVLFDDTHALSDALRRIINEIVMYRDHVENGGCGGKGKSKEPGKEDDVVQGRLDRLDQLIACAAEFEARTLNTLEINLLESQPDDTDGRPGDLDRRMVPMARSFVDECALLSPAGSEEILGGAGGVEKMAQGVQLMTMHASKGLEFDHVFIPGCIEGLVPLVQTVDNSLEEETRLFFVSITRAKKELRLFYTQMYMTRGRSVPASPSRFVVDLLNQQRAALLGYQASSHQEPNHQLNQDRYAKFVAPEKNSKAKTLQRRRAFR